MSELKTKPTEASVEEFLQGLADPKQRADCLTMLKLMTEVTKTKPRMWGSSIVGFGDYHYKYPSGGEGDWFLTGFSPRKGNLTLYIMAGFDGYADLLAKLGKYKTGKSCLYIKRLEDVDLATLKKLVKAAFIHVSKMSKNNA